MKILHETVIDNEACSYLNGHLQTTHYKIIESCDKQTCHTLTERGWRRFGIMFFRPVCAHCMQCESVKIDVNNYTFSRSERRVLNKNRDLTIVLQHPTLTHKHLDIHRDYHKFMQEKKGWDYVPTNAKHYYSSFIQGHGDFGYEVLYYLKNELIAVDIIDILPQGISSTYFIYDPKFASRSLGKLSLLHQIKLAKEYNLPWIYLGYYVENNSSLQYKAQYEPLHKLQGRPMLDEPYEWHAMDVKT